MATGKTVHYREGKPSRWRGILASALLLAVVSALAWMVMAYRAEARHEAARAVRIACVCRYVSNLPMSVCEDRLGAGSLALTERPEERSVSAGYPLMPHQSARYSEGPGCQLEAWDD